ncbi:MAG: aminopeptidase P family protein [Acidobacteria bacterium]|nr:aminopeptidase P family protein [Acidobacteriota bacterium]MBS1866914.1 aminopeptidase P family protein [Acidobacteriota bacterium]
MSFNLSDMQTDLRAAKLDGWLFYDFRGRDPIAHRILQLPDGMRTRRWFYFVPAKGTPKKLVHKIETASLAAVPGDTLYYSAQEELRSNLKKLIGRAKKIAMQYSAKNQIPYVSMVDAGTIELVRSTGVKILSSADLVQKYEAVWSPGQLESHLYAGKHVDRIVAEAFQRAARGVRENRPETEHGLQQWIREQFAAAGLTTEEGPDIAVNAHASDPHYAPSTDRPTPIKQGDLLLLDVWAKRNIPGSVYYDITWVGYLGARPPEKISKVFTTVRDARDKAVDLILESIAKGKPLQGWQVDRAARRVIEKAGFGKYFFHRTGHNIGTSVHGNGANMDGIETHDVRHLIPGTCTSVEPGIYLPEFGIRSEVNVYIGEKEARVTGAIQKELLALLA